MSKVTLLEEEEKKLTSSELAEFRAWYLEYDEGCWDRQIRAGVEAGRLDDMAAEAKGEVS
ncbi:MAG: hypothetical protein HND55_06875 [Pseudomonadota bacterium]|nr:MAG: hypothetical protein HND55_06875 [Pseudomonadota bacterium]